MGRKNRNTAGKAMLAIILILVSLAAFFPFVYMGLVSLTQKKFLNLNFANEVFSLVNYRTVFKNLNIGRNIYNSAVVTGGAVILNNIISSLAAYGFSKMKWKGRDIVFYLYILTLMIPGQVTLVPVFIIMKKLGLLNTHLAMMLPIINAFGVFLIRQFMIDIPDDLIDAAKIDGAESMGIFLRIMLPLIKPVLVSLTIFTFITNWNDFLWPLVICTDAKMQTLTLAIASLKGNYQINYGLVMAGSTIAFLPPFILYVFLQRQFVEGIALSGIKG